MPYPPPPYAQAPYGQPVPPYPAYPQPPVMPAYGAYPVYGNPYGYGMVPPRRNGLALTGMILGIVGLVSSIFFIGAVVGVVGLILALVGLSTARRTGVGKGFSIAGIVTSILAIIIGVIILIVAIHDSNLNNNNAPTACSTPGTTFGNNNCTAP